MEEYASNYCRDSSFSFSDDDVKFCAMYDKLGAGSDFAGEEIYTIFVPNNKAFEKIDLYGTGGLSIELFISIVYSNHIIRGKKVDPTDLLCNSFVDEMVLFQGTSSPMSKGKAPKIHCVNDIGGGTSSFIVGPGNNKKLDNLPRLSRGSEIKSPGKFCNGVFYIIDNVIVPKFLKGKALI
eukprot:CAMPEP_0170856444 /NCGR_PEP_ID=MMETSP0734-20130129/14598_1 /TAXON_ID=186038 /ORGANISM="Fragilariopsis kerguelensis, Strain L26-C5" /LENGTH=179 /DNA_ID=CAMNT_0011228287 /DNA_START=249 /DNA_END=788 /DNA_ORIENTATION=-